MKYKIKLAKPPAILKYKVYFDLETGKIEAITNKSIEGKETFFEVPVQDVEDFVSGNRNLTKHKVVFNVKEQRYNIVHDQDTIVVYADDLIFNIKQLKDAQVKILQDINRSEWKISASSTIKEQMKTVQSRLEETMYFSITEKGNPNILYNHFYVSIKDIIEQEFVSFPFSSQEEQTFDLVSVYTNRKFDKYTHEVIDE